MTAAPEPAAAGTPAAPDRRRWAALGVLAVALAMIVLDGTIVGVALPTIIDDLTLHLTDAEWVNSLYSMIFAALLISFGRLGNGWGRRRILVLGVALFVLGSLTAATAGSAAALIASRAVQGVGGAMVLPATLSTVNATFRGRDRAVAFGVWGAVMAGAAAIGPLLGGWLTTHASWRWIFWVNLPVGLLVVAGALLVVPATRGGRGAPGRDVPGLLTSAAGLGLLVFGLVEGNALGWWTPAADFTAGPLTWPADAPVSAAPVALAAGVVLLVAFGAWETHRARVGRAALLDVRLLALPTFTWGNVTALTVAAGEFGLVFVLPLFLVNALGLTVMQAGYVLAAMALGAFFSGSQARHLAARMPASRVVLLGLALEITGVAGAAAAMGVGRPVWWLAAALAVYGVGLGLASAQLTSTVLRDVPPAESGQGSATQSTFRQVGSALGAALSGTALATALTAVLPGRLGDVAGLPAAVADSLASATVDSAGGAITGLRDAGVHGQLGALGPQVADALAAGFADAARVSVLGAGAFLLLGLVGALRVDRVARAGAVAVPADPAAAPAAAPGVPARGAHELGAHEHGRHRATGATPSTHHGGTGAGAGGRHRATGDDRTGVASP